MWFLQIKAKCEATGITFGSLPFNQHNDQLEQANLNICCQGHAACKALLVQLVSR